MFIITIGHFSELYSLFSFSFFIQTLAHERTEHIIKYRLTKCVVYIIIWNTYTINASNTASLQSNCFN